MPWWVWLIITVVLLQAAQRIFSTTEMGEPFNPRSYDYEVSPELARYIKDNQKIAGIKLIRNETGLGLKNSKDLYEYLQEKS